MTLIAGAIVWNGICVGADTRATHTDPLTNNHTYTDDILKIDMLPVGLGIAVAGNCDTASIFREVFSRKLIENKKTDNSYDGPANIVKGIIEESLHELAFDTRVSRKPAEQTGIAGLIIGVDKGASLRLDQNECSRILEIVNNREINTSVWKKYKKNIEGCAKGEASYIELREYPQSTLFSFESMLGSRTSPGFLKVDRIPFGRVEALGSGKSGDHDIQQKNTLFYCLFGVDPDSPEAIDDSAVHVLRTHGWSERVVPINPKYTFPTFGGGYLAGAFLETPPNSGMVQFRVALGDYFRDATRTDLVCSVYINSSGRLSVRTRKGEEVELKKFWEYSGKATISMGNFTIKNLKS